MIFMDVLGFLFFIVVIVFILYHQFKLVFDRYLRTYKKDYKEYLKSLGYKYIDTWSPLKDDWSHSPFPKPPSFKITFFVTTPLEWTKTEYYIIIAKKSDKFKQFWVEITTSYFCKTKLIFKSGKNIKYNEEIDNLKKEYCPQCGYMIFDLEENNCPNCGFNTNT